MPITIRSLSTCDLHRFEEIDVSEDGTIVYRFDRGTVREAPEDWHRPRWSPASFRHHRDGAAAVLDRGGRVFGGFDDERLVAYATMRRDLEPETAQLADLQVARTHRRRGLAGRLLDEVVTAARSSGARRLYVSACPSRSAVGFYRSRGFAFVDRVNAELFALEPEDIHMVLEI